MYIRLYRKVDLLSHTEKRYLWLAEVNFRNCLSIIYIYTQSIYYTLSLLAFEHATRSIMIENQTMIDKNFLIRGNAISRYTMYVLAHSDALVKKPKISHFFLVIQLMISSDISVEQPKKILAQLWISQFFRSISTIF